MKFFAVWFFVTFGLLGLWFGLAINELVPIDPTVRGAIAGMVAALVGLVAAQWFYPEE